MTENTDDRVSRKRYERETAARAEAETLLEEKSRDLFLANQKLEKYSTDLEQAVLERTAEVRLALERTEAASAARSRFLATMSHEIRTPLGGLLGMIDLLEMDEQEPGKLELLNYAKTAGVGLSRIVNDVLDFSKMEAGVFLFEEENVDIRALIESVKILAQSHDTGADRQIVSKVSDSVPKLFLGDATRIRQVISNFVSNAIRYSFDGPITIKATAKGDADKTILRLEVEDFGVGIDAEGISNLFKDFTQISNPLTAAAQGAGLGLAICKRIINGVGGEISVDSTLGEGSTFWFEIEIETVDLPDTIGTDGRDTPLLLPPEGIEGTRVLIAEDNTINQKLLLTYADKMGLIADLAEDGSVALQKFAPGKYDLVLMDIAMPVMDGLEATRRIRDRWDPTDVPPILALTAHVMDAIEDEAEQVGIDRILSKPIPFQELKHAIEDVLAGGLKTTQQTPRPSAKPRKAKAKPETSSARSLVDLMAPDVHKNLVEIFGLDGLSDFAEKFLRDSSDRIEKLMMADKNGNVQEVQAQAHSLKGAALALGFPDMVHWAKKIELGETERDDMTVRETAEKFRAKLTELSTILMR
ncbi:hybrid sensor histidine kinase/response regulator [Loktanella sp. D2R18]|uniref:ATP-binding protein n=1 Tax=Rhodobacterales TaxID=204455 RepID=UPI000DE8ADF9|nr:MULTISPECIES: ATP-binding protein [Rhodobacterales]MDO6591881.1 response regulator [Yoonia sp. 1_MG-2023]RBW42687.1 hybrid sensor histidine kinase/response regulator [Loktanella sp. D2R18]